MYSARGSPGRLRRSAADEQLRHIATVLKKLLPRISATSWPCSPSCRTPNRSAQAASTARASGRTMQGERSPMCVEPSVAACAGVRRAGRGWSGAVSCPSRRPCACPLDLLAAPKRLSRHDKNPKGILRSVPVFGLGNVTQPDLKSTDGLRESADVSTTETAVHAQEDHRLHHHWACVGQHRADLRCLEHAGRALLADRLGGGRGRSSPQSEPGGRSDRPCRKVGTWLVRLGWARFSARLGHGVTVWLSGYRWCATLAGQNPAGVMAQADRLTGVTAGVKNRRTEGRNYRRKAVGTKRLARVAELAETPDSKSSVR